MTATVPTGGTLLRQEPRPATTPAPRGAPVEDGSAALYARFLRGLERSPDGVALRSDGGRLTYREMHAAALERAGSVLAAIGRPRAIGVLAGKQADDYVNLLAALYAGVPMVPLQPSFPAARTLQMMAATGIDVLLSSAAGADALRDLRHEGVDVPVLAPRDVNRGGTWIRSDPARALARPQPVGASDVAYVLFTSGSTGRPKGVPVTNANTAHYFGLLDDQYDFGPSDVFSQTFDLNFDCAMFDLFCAWGAGATVVPVPPRAYLELGEFLDRERVTVWFSTPSAISLVRRVGTLTPGSLPTLRWSLFAGEALTCQDAQDWHRAAPGSTLENLYGPTELTITVSRHRWDPERSTAMGVNGVVPIGTVHAGHEHLLLDTDGSDTDGSDTDGSHTDGGDTGGSHDGDEGELCIAGPQLTAGYLDPADDEGRFFERGGVRFYRTGDRVRRGRGGELLYLGRGDGQVQVRGVRVELAEVDAAVRECDGVEDAVTVAVPDGESLALVVWYTGVRVPAVDLARSLRRTLPPAVIPKTYRHVDAFPLNPNRKIDRGRLAQMAGLRRTGAATTAGERA